MTRSAPGHSLSRISLHLLVLISGVAALSWEVLWQLKASLALGVSAWGTALTLAVTMGGMCVGSLVMGRVLRDKAISRPVRLYGVLEMTIGIAGLLLGVAFEAVEHLDTLVYSKASGSAMLVHLLGIAATLGVPTVCMGATVPVFGLVARQFRSSIAVLYGLNTLGAACGALSVALFLIPRFGVSHTAWIVAALNLIIGASAWAMGPGESVAGEGRGEGRSRSPVSPAAARMVVLVTGYATFSLEVAWFRSLTAAFRSTTDAFALMLSCVLLSLGVAARLAPALKQKGRSLGSLVTGSGALILLATPLVERFDLVPYSGAPLQVLLGWFFMTLLAIGAPVALLGVALPWVLDDQDSPRGWGITYALNTFAAIAGSLGTAWLLLPAIGFARTAWLAGAVVVTAGIAMTPRPRRLAWGAIGAAALLLAMRFESGVGKTRTQGKIVYATHRLLEFFEGPEATVSAVEYDNGGRALIIDGFLTAAQVGWAHYMAWMGHLPMLLHPDPENALVICFGTGQTSNAVRQEGPRSLDIVDINPRVLKLAHNFPSNQGVLDDPRVRTIIMDGRAYMRRSTKTYDVITLEPMPANFAGANALYSREFYELARKRLAPGGTIAQWVSLWLVAPRYNASIVRTFQQVFPNAILWVDPVSETGILLGTKDEGSVLGTSWPGFNRTGIIRDLSEEAVRGAVFLDPDGARRYGSYGTIIDDDNQLLAYGEAVYGARFVALKDDNFALLNQARTRSP